ncbi:MAG: hypothetical protein ACLVJH_12020 [Faecalibacterium prausnitzii]
MMPSEPQAKRSFRHVQHPCTMIAGEGSPDCAPTAAASPYYLPDFKFRTCLYAHCPYKKQVNVFRLHTENGIFSMPEKSRQRTADLDYFYGQSSELFSYRIPKLLFQDVAASNRFPQMPTLYGILLPA